MIWGEDDCLVDILGPAAHDKIGWVRDFETHNDALTFVASLPEVDRRRLFCWTAVGQGWFSVEDPRPGDVGIGEFVPAVGADISFPSPWFAVMQPDFLWYVRMPRARRVALIKDMYSTEFYRCPQQQ